MKQKDPKRCGTCGHVGFLTPHWVYVARAWQCPKCVRADARAHPHPKDPDDSPYYGATGASER